MAVQAFSRERTDQGGQKTGVMASRETCMFCSPGRGAFEAGPKEAAGSGPGHLAETRRAFRGGFEATSVTSAAQCGSVYVTRRRVGSNSCDPVKERPRSAQLP